MGNHGIFKKERPTTSLPSREHRGSSLLLVQPMSYEKEKNYFLTKAKEEEK